jgi:hypothetical protein
MPAPLGQQPRNRKFLLRMTAPEDEYVRGLARARSTSLNDAITGLIRERIAAEQPTPPPTPPPAPPAAAEDTTPKKRRRLHSRNGLTEVYGPPPETSPGQTSITEQESP